ncbi:MAG: hybrid sensor histidine kinase/response regulator [Rhodospirillaceae bacterium]
MSEQALDILEFAEESVKPRETATDQPWLVLVVDDEPDVIAITRTALTGCAFEKRPLQIIGAGSAAAGRALLEQHPEIAVVLLDVVMETDDAGLRLAVAIREELQRQAVRIVLRTGQPGFAPERDVILRYDINDYRLKTDLTAQSLFTTVIAALRGYTEIVARLRAEEAAVLANRAKTEFLANINHELRTPLNAIIGLAELMDNEVFGTFANETYRGFVRDIITSGKALNETLGAILDVANIEFTNLKLTPECLDAATLFQRVVKPLAPQAARAGISITEQVPETLPQLWGDGRRLRQLLLNLLSNAIKFNRSGGLVALRAETAGDGRVVLSITDTGIGMTAEDIRVALTPFGQVDGSLSRRRDGSGLGLPLARMIADLHGGGLEIASTPGHGTTVRVTLPAAQTGLRSPSFLSKR